MRAHGAMALPTQAGTIMPTGLAHGQRPDQLTGPFPASLQALMWGRLHGGHPSEKSPILGSHMVAVSHGGGDHRAAVREGPQGGISLRQALCWRVT